MSRLLSLLNRLKVEANKNILTDSQLSALNEIERFWRFPERINLCGPLGSGKTMVGWVVARSLHGSFYPSPRIFRERSQHGQPHVVIDNVPHDQYQLRSLVGEMQLKEISNSLFITTEANRLGLPIIALAPPSAEDIGLVYRNLNLIEYYTVTPLREGDFWDVIHSVL